MKQTGQMLKTQREANNLSINEVSMTTKINPRILIAIEDGNKSALPPKTFVRGFVVTYSEFLKLNKDEVLKVFNEEMQCTPLEVAAPESGPINPKNTTPFLKQTNLASKIAIVSVILILIGVILIVNNVVNKYKTEEENVNPINQNLPRLSENEKTPKKENIEASTSESSKKTEDPVDSSKKIIKKEDQKEETSLLNKPDNNLKIKNINSNTPAISDTNLEKTTESDEKILESNDKKNEKNSEIPKELPKRPATEVIKPKPNLIQQEVIIEALDRVKIKYKSLSDNSIKEITLEPDQVHTIKAKGVIELNFTDGGAINLTLNGKDLGVPGSLGQSLSLKLPR